MQLKREPKRRPVLSFAPAEDGLKRKRFSYLNLVNIDHSISDGAKTLYKVLDDHSRMDDEAFPKQSTIARILGISRREVIRRINELRDAGHLQTIRRKTHLVYRLAWNQDVTGPSHQMCQGGHISTLYMKREKETHARRALSLEPNPKPKTKQPAANLCADCRGTGKSYVWGEACNYCQGKGRF